jgi:Tfp pilus assembly protein PilO
VNRRVRLALGGILIVALALVVFFMLINPIRGDIAVLRSKIDDENAKITKAEQELLVAEGTRSEGRRNQAKLMELAKMIPSSPEVPSLILQVQDLADKAGITWIQVSPSEPSATLGLPYQTISLSLNFRGSFYDVSDFIYRAEQMVAGPGRLLAVKDVALSPETIKGGGSVPFSVILSVRMTVYAFVTAETISQTPASSPSSGGSDSNTSTTVTAQ